MALSHHFQAMALNNQGVTHLEMGQYREAQLAFKVALDFVKMAMDDTEKEDGNVMTMEWGKPPRCCSTNNRSVNENPLVLSFVYERALLIQPLQSCKSSATAIVFNLGLTYHLSGLLGASSHLDRALHFYQIAYTIQSRQEGNKSSLPCQANFGKVLEIAILNNMGQIYYELVEYEAATQCFRRLSIHLRKAEYVLSDIVDSQEDLAGIVLNIILDSPGTAPAA